MTEQVLSIVLSLLEITEDTVMKDGDTMQVDGIYLFTCSECGEIMLEGERFDLAAQSHIDAEHNGAEFTIGDQPVEEEAPVVHTCAGTTNSGNPCSRTVSEEGEYCYQHQPTEEAEDDTTTLPAPPETITVVVEEEEDSDPFEAFNSSFERIMKSLGGFVEDAKAHEETILSYGQRVRDKEAQIDNLRQIVTQLEGMAPVPAVVDKIEYINEAITELSLLVVDMQMSPLFAEYRSVESALHERKERAERIREKAMASEQKMKSNLNSANAMVEEKRRLFTDILHGKKWLPSLEFDAEPLIKNAWYRANSKLKKANINGKERRNFGVYAQKAVLPVVFKEIFRQYMNFDEGDIKVGEAVVPGFTEEEAYRQFLSVFERTHWRFHNFNKLPKSEQEQRGKMSYFQFAAREFWGELDERNMAVRLLGKTRAERFIEQNDVVSLSAEDIEKLMRVEAAQKDDPKAEEPIS